MLNGVPQQEKRWMRVQAATDRALGEALGQLYVRRAFSPEAKAKMIELVANLRAALNERIQKLDWMGPETKAQALRKLAAFDVKIGYPDKWRDYSALDDHPRIVCREPAPRAALRDLRATSPSSASRSTAPSGA